MKGLFVDGIFNPFRQIPVLPEGYPGPVIRASTILFVKGDFGRVTCQQLVSGPFGIWYNVYEAFSDCRIRFHHKKPFLGVHAMLEGEPFYEINGVHSVFFKEQQCDFYYQPLLDSTIHLQKGCRYQCLVICLKADQVKQYLTHFDTAKRFAQKLFAKKPAVLHGNPLLLNFVLKAILQEILVCTATPDLQNLFVKIKIHEFLFHFFAASVPVDPVKPEIRDRLLEVKKGIEQNFTHHVPIRKLAKKSGMNTTSFKSAFKTVFGMGPFEYLVETRLRRALELLRKRELSIQRVADTVGYKSFGSFIKAFKRKYGDTPGQIKKTFPVEP